MWGPLSGANQNVIVSAVVPVVPVYIGATINRASAGNGKLDLEFDVNINSPGGNYEAGFTIECRAPSGTWYALDPAAYTAALQDSKYIRFSLTGLVNTFQASHEIRVSYSSTTGDIASSATGDDLATFSDVTALTNSSTVDLLASLIERYSFDEVSGTRTASITTPGNDLTDANTVGSNTGMFSTAAEFVSANLECLTHVDNADLSSFDGSMTWAIWVRPADHTNYEMWMGQWDGGANRGFSLWKGTGAGGNFNVDWSQNGVDGFALNSGVAYVNNTWHCLIFWYDKTNTTIGISQDDSAPATDSINAANLNDSSLAFWFSGSSGHNFYFVNGRMDEPTKWHKILSAAERTDWRNSGNGKAWPFIPDHT